MKKISSDKITEKVEKQIEKQKKKSKETMKEFNKFAFSGNIFDMSVGVIIGTAFKSIVTSFTNDLIMPVISIFTKHIDFNNMFISLDGNSYDTLELAKQAGASTLNYGSFITTIIDFFITAIFVFIAIRQIKKINEKILKQKESTTKKCEYCKTEINKDATRCPHCTSELTIDNKNTVKKNDK